MKSSLKLSKRDSAIIAYHIGNPDATLETVGTIFKTSKHTVSVVLTKYYNSKTNKIFVVPSLQEENTFFAFNDINERKFTVNMFGLVDERHQFTRNERKQLEEVGFSF